MSSSSRLEENFQNRNFANLAPATHPCKNSDDWCDVLKAWVGGKLARATMSILPRRESHELDRSNRHKPLWLCTRISYSIGHKQTDEC